MIAEESMCSQENKMAQSKSSKEYANSIVVRKTSCFSHTTLVVECRKQNGIKLELKRTR